MNNSQLNDRLRDFAVQDRQPFPAIASDVDYGDELRGDLMELKAILVDADRLVSSSISRAIDGREVHLSWLERVAELRPAYLALLPKLADDEVFTSNVPALIDRLEKARQVLRKFAQGAK